MEILKKTNIFLSRSYEYFFVLLITILPFSNSLPNIIFGILLLFYGITFKKDEFKEYLKSPFILLAVFLIYLILKSLFFKTFFVDLDVYKKYSYLILIPVLFTKVKNVRLLKTAALVAINASILVSLFKVGRFYFFFNYLPFADDWATNHVLVLERPYAGLYSILAIIISFDLFVKNRNIKSKTLYGICFFLSLFFIFFIAIRISILTFFLLAFIYVFFYMRISRLKRVSLILLSLAFFLLILQINKNISKRFFINETIEQTKEQIKNFEPRVVIWDCALGIYDEKDFSALFGLESNASISNKLVACYDKSLEDYNRRNWFLNVKFNTHSQFIDFFLIGGFVGIMLLSSFLIKSFLVIRTNFYALAILFSFMMSMSIENIFHRQFGCLIFSIFTAIYISRNELKCLKLK